MLNDSRIYVSIGRTGGDETSPYYIRFKEPITVRDFVKAQLKDTREFGVINIYDKTMNNNALYCLTYDRGKITGGRIPESYYNLIVEDAGGSGGWGRSDFNVIVNTDDDDLFENSSDDQEVVNIDMVGKKNEVKQEKSTTEDTHILTYDTRVIIDINIARKALRISGAINPLDDNVSDTKIIKAIGKLIKDYGVSIQGFN